VIGDRGVLIIDAMINRGLTDLRREVSAALGEGFDPAAASDRVSKLLELSYGTYKIFPWVNTQLKVQR
jgi:hypothetical protein